jgi:prophage antirepressor-like protein
MYLYVLHCIYYCISLHQYTLKYFTMEKLFQYNESKVRTQIDENGDFWFAGIDVCNILEYQNSTDIIEKKLDEDEKKLDYLTDSSGQKRKTWTINESGLYSLILSSTKSEAKIFRRWVTHDVLPALRKAGKYTTEEEREREETIQVLVAEIEKLISDRDDLRDKANRKTKDIDLKNAQLMQFLKTDFRQKKIQFPE